MTKFCVLYLKNGIEHRSAWFGSLARCRQALQILTDKHGYQAVVFMD